jgi:activator-of-BECN1-regulated-autophagy protein 1
VPRALLYNDGGFDVSPDGNKICACAEYWLPDGVDNAMDLLETEIDDDDNDDDDMDGKDEINGNNPNKPQNETPTSATTVPFSSASNAKNATSLSPPRNPMPRVSLNISAPLRPQTPQTPPPNPRNLTLSPPSPPGRRFAGGFNERLPPPPGMQPEPRGRYVPHVVTISLDTSPNEFSNDPNHLQAMLHPPHHPQSPYYNNNKKQKKPPQTKPKLRPRLGQLLQACPLDGAKASAVTCVKFSPSTKFCLIGYGVREPIMQGNPAVPLHPVTALYATSPKMTHVSTMLSADDDVNIARFHPHSGMGFCYGTKQGRVRVLGPRPWNYYNC